MNASTEIHSSPTSQRGVSLVVALVMLLVLTLIGISSMNTAIVELKMAGSSQQQGIALNRADELLHVGEQDVLAIVQDPGPFNFSTVDDGYYTAADNINVHDISWEGLNSIQGSSVDESYVVQYMGAKALRGESVRTGGGKTGNTGGGTGGGIAGSYVYSFLITSRSEAGKGALRLVQSIYVTSESP